MILIYLLSAQHLPLSPAFPYYAHLCVHPYFAVRHLGFLWLDHGLCQWLDEIQPLSLALSAIILYIYIYK